jgi:serine/threonine protein kinase/Tfp pilus assembly protein PilF
MASEDVMARFEAERQALAMMDHPNIASVLDGGSTEAGQPFFVMELVRGVPITAYCDRRRISTTERLRLFTKVCRAVQHAHQKGIIHRDIKPSNVLVPEIDGEAVPKVIDFGVAKAVSQKLTDQTVYTHFAQVVGTPLYMSPEQAGSGVVDIDTRSDVYSLGVLLYELLTGSTPFARETLKQYGFDEFRRMLREDEPRRPSQAISTLKAEAMSTISDQRACDPRKLTQAVRGELDWIVMKALEKDRSRRYETASALAADIQRYLDEEPVQACPPSVLYRARKFGARNRNALLTGTLVTSLIVVGLTYLVNANLQSERVRQRVTQDVQQSLAAALTAIETDSLAVASQRVGEAEGRLAQAAGDLPELESAIKTLSQEISERSQQQTQFKQFVELADVAMNNTSRNKSSDDQGAPKALEALEIYGVLSDNRWHERLPLSFLSETQQGTVRETAYELLLTLADYGIRWKSSSKKTAEQSLDYLERAQAFHQPTRAFYWLRADCHKFLNHEQEAKQDLQTFQTTTATTALDYYLPGQTLNRKGDWKAAIHAFEQALQIQPDHYMSLFFLATRFAQEGQLQRAADVYRACLAIRATDFSVLQNRGRIMAMQGNYDEALGLFNQALDVAQRPSSIASTLSERGILYAEMGEYEKALADFGRALEIVNGSDNPDVQSLMNIYLNRAHTFGRIGADDKALADLDAVMLELEAAANSLPEKMKKQLSVDILIRRGRVLSNNEDDRAISDIDEALRIAAEPGIRVSDDVLATAHALKGRNLLYTGRQTEAILACNRALQLSTKDNQEALCVRAEAFYETDQFDAALRDLDAIIESAPDKLTPFSAWAHNQLAWMLTSWPDVSRRDIPRAVELATKAVEYAPSNGDYLHTLGVAQYRAGDHSAAVKSLSASLEDAESDKDRGLFLAMAYQQLGDERQAREWYERAAKWMTDNDSTDKELIRFRQEAEETLGIASEAETPTANSEAQAESAAEPALRLPEE